MSTSHEEHGAQDELFARLTTLPTSTDDPAWFELGEVLARIHPGPALAALLIRLKDCDPNEYFMVEIAAACHRMAAWSHAQLTDAAARLAEYSVFTRHDDLPSSPLSRDIVGDELAMRLGLSKRAGRTIVRDGHAFSHEFEPTAEALEVGAIDAAKARSMVTHLQHVAGPIAMAVQLEVLPLAPTATLTQLVKHIQRALIAVAPDDATLRHRRARKTRRVDHPRLLPDGMAGIYAVLPAADAITLDLVLEGAARTAKAHGDTRTLDQLRADALSLLGHTAHDAGHIGHGEGHASPRDGHISRSDGHISRKNGHGNGHVSHNGASIAQPSPPGAQPTGPPGPFDAATAPVIASTADRARQAPPGPMRIGHIGRTRPQIRITVPLSVALPEDLAEAFASRRQGDPPFQGRTVPSRSLPPPAPTANGKSPPDPPPLCCDHGPCCLKDGPCCIELNPYGLGGPVAEVAELEGYGPISPDVARALALGGTWQRLIVDPHSGAVLDVGRRRYKPPAELAAFVRERDRTCIRPGCPTPARHCDLDHTTPWRAGGLTAATNLAALCPTDHALKSLGAFQLRHADHGGYEWTTPAGHRYLRDATGTVHRLSPLTRGWPRKVRSTDAAPGAAGSADAAREAATRSAAPFPDEPPF